MKVALLLISFNLFPTFLHSWKNIFKFTKDLPSFNKDVLSEPSVFFTECEILCGRLCNKNSKKRSYFNTLAFSRSSGKCECFHAEGRQLTGDEKLLRKDANLLYISELNFFCYESLFVFLPFFVGVTRSIFYTFVTILTVFLKKIRMLICGVKLVIIECLYVLTAWNPENCAA